MSLSPTPTTKLTLEHTHHWDNSKTQAFLHSPDWTCTPPLRFNPGAEPLGSGQGEWEWTLLLSAPGPSYGISSLSLTAVSVWYTGPPLWLKEARPKPTATPGQRRWSQAVALPGSQHGQLCRTPWLVTLYSPSPCVVRCWSQTETPSSEENPPPIFRGLCLVSPEIHLFFSF